MQSVAKRVAYEESLKTIGFIDGSRVKKGLLPTLFLVNHEEIQLGSSKIFAQCCL